MATKKFLWVDLEMTGLDETRDVIIEFAAIVTDIDLKSLEEYHAIVFQPPEKLAQMDEWCTKTHGESGLTAQIPNGKPLAKVEEEICELLSRHFTQKGKEHRPILAGNSISQDRKFIDRYMKDFSSRLHYRMVDVSSYKEIFKHRWGLEFKKENKHRAIDDIKESIRELDFYLGYVHPKSDSSSNQTGQ